MYPMHLIHPFIGSITTVFNTSYLICIITIVTKRHLKVSNLTYL